MLRERIEAGLSQVQFSLQSGESLREVLEELKEVVQEGADLLTAEKYLPHIARWYLRPNDEFDRIGLMFHLAEQIGREEWIDPDSPLWQMVIAFCDDRDP